MHVKELLTNAEQFLKKMANPEISGLKTDYKRNHENLVAICTVIYNLAILKIRC